MSEFADWVRGILLQGLDPDGVLRTIRLDDAGRISAFIIDSTDAWDQMLTIGNAELAARLGGLQVFDRRGQIQFGEDFGKGWRTWKGTAWGGGGAVALDPVDWLRGGYSVKLTAGDDDEHKARVQKLITYVPSARMGAEAVFSIESVTSSIELWLSIYTGTRSYEVKVRYDCANSNLDVWDDTPGWVTVDDTFTMYSDIRLFHSLKVVWDMENDTCLRVLANGLEYDATAWALEGADLVFTPAMSVTFTNVGVLAENDVVNLDSVVITNQEPE